MRILIVLALVAPALAEVKPMEVRKVIKGKLREIAACFEAHGDHDARVEMDFTIRKDGKTRDVAASGPGNKDLHGCLVGVFKRMQFPASSTETKVHYPVHIITAGG